MKLLMRLVAACVSARGFSATETAVVLTATSILTASATPNIVEYLEIARATKATNDVRVIGLALVRLTDDVHSIFRGPNRPSLLVSEGAAPAVIDPAKRSWGRPIDGRTTRLLSDYLTQNGAGVDGFAPSLWRGPYVEGLSPDPWGTRYAVNIGVLDNTKGYAVVVVSAGPNRIIETPFEAVGISSGGDDVVSVIGRGR